MNSRRLLFNLPEQPERDDMRNIIQALFKLIEANLKKS
jgi:hypothetical protein